MSKSQIWCISNFDRFWFNLMVCADMKYAARLQRIIKSYTCKFIHWFMRCWGCNIWFILKCAEGDICVSIKMYKPCVNILWSFTRLKFFSPFLRNIFKSTLSPIIKLNLLRCVSFRILHWWMFSHFLHKDHQWACYYTYSIVNAFDVFHEWA